MLVEDGSMWEIRVVWLVIIKALDYIRGTWCCRCRVLGAEKHLAWRCSVGDGPWAEDGINKTGRVRARQAGLGY